MNTIEGYCDECQRMVTWKPVVIKIQGDQHELYECQNKPNEHFSSSKFYIAYMTQRHEAKEQARERRIEAGTLEVTGL